MKTKAILALGALALVLAITTGAGAAAKHLITGSDVKNGSLTGLDIKNGSVNAGDLSSSATRSLSAKSEPGAKGDTGAQGDKGDAGAKGDKGDAGGKGDKGEKGDKGDDGRDAVDGLAPGDTTRGVIGGDYHNFDAAQSVDFGAQATLQQFTSKPGGITDDDVFVNVTTWQNGGGQSAPTTTDDDPGCDGTVDDPTAPEGKVCIYVSGADNAKNLSGYSATFGSTGSKYGFKLKWDASGTKGDSFVDAVWAYTEPTA